MVADVTSFLSHRQERSPNSEILITKDLLGGLSKVSDFESDLGSKKEQRRHDRCNSPNSPLSSSSSSICSAGNKKNHNQETNPDSDFQDLNCPPTSSKQQINSNFFLEETCLDLKLQSSTYQSVCTLDKVKSALQRAEKETLDKKRPSPGPSTSTISSAFNSNSSPSSSSPSSGTGMFAAGCPGCLLYVITLKTNPKCPRCNSTVPSPLAMKKRKIDLNFSF